MYFSFHVFSGHGGFLSVCLYILIIFPDGFFVKHGSLNVIGPHNLIGSGTIRKCGFVGGSASLCGQALWFPMLRISSSVSVDFLLSAGYRNLGYYSSTMSACTPPCSWWNELLKYNQAFPIKCFTL